MAKVDLTEAQHLLDGGKSVLEVALHFQVAPQTIYDLLRRGRLLRPVASSG